MNLSLDFDRNEVLRILNVITHAILFLQMLTWTVHTKHENKCMKAVRLVWALMTLGLAMFTWKYWYLFGYAVLHVIWQVTICVHIFLIKQFAKDHDCPSCTQHK